MHQPQVFAPAQQRIPRSTAARNQRSEHKREPPAPRRARLLAELHMWVAKPEDAKVTTNEIALRNRSLPSRAAKLMNRLYQHRCHSVPWSTRMACQRTHHIINAGPRDSRSCWYL